VYPFDQGEYVDIGSPKDLMWAVRQFGSLELERNNEIIF